MAKTQAQIDRDMDEVLESAGAEDYEHLVSPQSNDPAYIKGWMNQRELDRNLLRELEEYQRKAQKK